jgi:ADP-ribose pyrophosphatase
VTDPQVVFQGRKFRVERRDYTINGRPHTFEIVTHAGAAVILPVLDDGRIVLIYNYRVAVGAELLELPAGTIDGAEPPEACAARELAEETGYRAGRLTPLLAFYSSPGVFTERMHSFLATDLAAGATAHEGGEQIRVAPLALADAIAAIRAGRIVDAKTIVTLLYYDRFVRRDGGAR